MTERCELCAAPIPSIHPHLLEIDTRDLRCSCQACTVLFPNGSEARFKRVPDRVTYLRDFTLSEEQWNSLSLPIDLVFFVDRTDAGRVVAIYPGPAGPAESALTLGMWEEIAKLNSIDLEPDVEALLIDRRGTNRDHFLVPIDECYKLVGIIRSKWRGLSGGSDVRNAIDGFFDSLRERSSRKREAAYA